MLQETKQAFQRCQVVTKNCSMRSIYGSLIDSQNILAIGANSVVDQCSTNFRHFTSIFVPRSHRLRIGIVALLLVVRGNFCF